MTKAGILFANLVKEGATASQIALAVGCSGLVGTCLLGFGLLGLNVAHYLTNRRDTQCDKERDEEILAILHTLQADARSGDIAAFIAADREAQRVAYEKFAAEQGIDTSDLNPGDLRRPHLILQRWLVRQSGSIGTRDPQLVEKLSDSIHTTLSTDLRATLLAANTAAEHALGAKIAAEQNSATLLTHGDQLTSIERHQRHAAWYQRRGIQFTIAGIILTGGIGAYLIQQSEQKKPAEKTNQQNIASITEDQKQLLATANRIETLVDTAFRQLKPGEKPNPPAEYDKARDQVAKETGTTSAAFLQALNNILPLAKNSLQPDLDTARLQLAIGDYPAAEKAAQAAVDKAGPCLRDARDLLSRSQFAQLKWDPAIDNLALNAAQIDPDSDPTWLPLHWRVATMLDAADRPREALLLWEKIIIHLQKQPAPDTNKIADAIGWAASAYDDLGDWKNAFKYRKRVIEVNTLDRKPDDRESLNALNSLASSIEASGDIQAAHDLYRDTIVKAAKALGDDDDVTLSLRGNLADLLHGTGDINEAIEIAEDVIKRRLKKKTTPPAHLLASYRMVGALYMEQDRYEEALAMLESAVQGATIIYGEQHAETLNCRNMLARLYQDTGKIDEAEKIQTELRKLRTDRQGPEHPATLTTLNNLALLHDQQGKEEDSEALYRQVIAAREKKYPAKHPETLHAQNNLASVLEGRGKTEEAEKLYRHVLATRREIYEGPETPITHDHPNTLLSLANLGAFLRGQSRFDEAEKLLLDAIERTDAKLGSYHERTLFCADQLGLLYKQKADYQKSIRYFSGALKERIHKFGDKHHDTLDNKINLAWAHSWNGEHEESLHLLRQVYENTDKENPKVNHFYTLAGRWVANDLMRLFRDAEALPFFDEALARWKIHYPKDTDTLINLHRSYGISLRRLGRMTEAEQHHRKALALAEGGKDTPPLRIADLCETLCFTLSLLDEHNEAAEVAIRSNEIYAGQKEREGDDGALNHYTLARAHWVAGNKSEALEEAKLGLALLKKPQRPNKRLIVGLETLIQELK